MDAAPFMVPVLDLLTPAFVLRYTSHRDLQALLWAGGLPPQGLLGLTETPSASWDAFIARSSRFANWAALLSQARGEWLARRLGWANDTC